MGADSGNSFNVHPLILETSTCLCYAMRIIIAKEQTSVHERRC